jgi:hypothetical protein
MGLIGVMIPELTPELQREFENAIKIGDVLASTVGTNDSPRILINQRTLKEAAGFYQTFGAKKPFLQSGEQFVMNCLLYSAETFAACANRIVLCQRLSPTEMSYWYGNGKIKNREPFGMVRSFSGSNGLMFAAILISDEVQIRLAPFLMSQSSGLIDPNAYAEDGGRTNTPLMCYKMAYVVLPETIFRNTDATLEQLEKHIRSSGGESAGFRFFVQTCSSCGCVPSPQYANSFAVYVGNLTLHLVYIIFGYPEPEPVNLTSGLPILAPYYSGAVWDDRIAKLSYFVLGQALDGSTTLRSVSSDGTQTNLGSGSAPNLPAFIDLLKDQYIYRDSADTDPQSNP